MIADRRQFRHHQRLGLAYSVEKLVGLEALLGLGLMKEPFGFDDFSWLADFVCVSSILFSSMRLQTLVLEAMDIAFWPFVASSVQLRRAGTHREHRWVHAIAIDRAS